MNIPAPIRGRWWLRARRVIAGIIAGLVACEILLRLVRVFGLPGSILLYARQDLYWEIFPLVGTVEELATIVPGAMGPYGHMYGYVLNSRGLRTPEYAVERRKGAGRIVVIGDSFMCLPGGPDDSKHIANVLGRQMGTEVVNLGLPTAGPKFYLRMLEVEGVRLKPDCAVFFLFVGNDLTEEGETGRDASAGEFLTAHSYLYRIGRNLSRLSPAEFRLTDERMRRNRMGEPKVGGYFKGCPDCWPWDPTMKPGQFERVQSDRAVVFVRPWPDWLEEHWQYLSVTLRQIKQTAAGAGIPVLFVLIPDVTQVESRVQDIVRSNLNGLRLDLDAPQRRIKSLCANAGIPVLDLLPAFRAADKKGVRTYLPLDTHWSPEGQELAGRLVAAKIRNLLPSK